MTQTYKPHISEIKKKEIDDIKRLCKEYPVIGIINLEGLPTLMLQRIKYAMGDSVKLKITKKSLIKFAFEELKSTHKNIEKLNEKLEGIPALLFTKEDPFLIFKKLEKNKASAVAKPGQKAPNDLGVEAGETPFTPGPMIGELGMLGLKTEVKNGKIHLKNGKVLVKDGEVISEQVASLLAKLGVEPMRIGFNLLLTYQNGEILEKAVLNISEEEYIDNIKKAYSEAFALAAQVGIITSETIKPLVMKAQRESIALSESADIMTSENIGRTFAKAETAASALNAKVPDTPAGAPKEKPTEKKEEPEIKEQQAQIDTSKEAPVEQPKEDSTPKPAQEEQKSEIPEKQQEKASKEEPKDIKPENPIEDKTQEVSMEETAKLAHKIIGSGIKEYSKESKEQTPKAEQDINKIINALKDKKSEENK